MLKALAIKRSPQSLGYAVQKVSGDNLEIAHATTIPQGLIGKVAGLNITQASGVDEGRFSRIVTRGNTSLTGENRALIIVDGMAALYGGWGANGVILITRKKGHKKKDTSTMNMLSVFLVRCIQRINPTISTYGYWSA